MRSSVVFLFLLAAINCSAQISVNVVTPEEAVAILCGPNVQYSNISFTGSPEQLGSYVNATGNFAISEGILLSTDAANGVVLPAEIPTPLTSPVDGEPDLLDVANSVPPLIGEDFVVGAVNNVAILEFDFVATGPSLSFNYIFGSDEYLAWVNSQYNDVFAFFISGPGISGDYWSPAGFPDGSANIAVVPNSVPMLPITISSVNNVLNSAYYIDNQNIVDVGLNGYTTVIAATSDLQCGQTYHMRLAVAHGTDWSLKSIVALQAGSFNLSGSFLEVGPVSPPPGFSSNAVLEGCIHGELVINAPDCAEDFTVTINTGGTAVNGLDYTFIPSTVTFDGAESTLVLPLEFFYDELFEGTENLTVEMIYTNTAGELDTASVALDILDYTAPSVTVDDVFVCELSATASAEIEGGFGPFQYTWSNGGTNSSQTTFFEGDAGEYSLNVIDYCGTAFDSTFVVIEPTPFVVDPFVDICFNLTSNSIASGGAPPYIVVLPEDSLELTGDYQIRGLFNGVYPLIVEDQCGSSGPCRVTVQVCETKIPNVFTPNGDGFNDSFHVFGLEGFPGSQVMIFDRWGKKVLDDGDYKNNWDGEGLSDGIYYYIVKRSDGKTYEGHIQKMGSK